MLGNLITSLIIAFGVGVSSIDMDDNSISVDEPSNSFVNNVYDGVLWCSSTEHNYNQLINRFPGLQFYDYFTIDFYPSTNGYIIGDKGYSSSFGEDSEEMIRGSHQNLYYGLSIWLGPLPPYDYQYGILVYDSNGNSVNFYKSYPTNVPFTNKDEYLICSNLYLRSVSGSGYDSIGDVHYDSQYLYDNLNGILDYLTLPYNSLNNSENIYFQNFISQGGYYDFSPSFNPWSSIFYNLSDGMNFGQLTYGENTNYYTSQNDDIFNYFINDFSDSDYILLKYVDIFEGLFYFGGKPYTNIRLYFTCSYQYVNFGSGYIEYDRSIVQFVYASFYNSSNLNEYVFLSTKGYRFIGSGLNPSGSSYTGIYQPNVDTYTNYNTDNNDFNPITILPYSYDGIYYSELYFNYIPSVQFLYSLNRPQNVYNMKSGQSFYQLLGFTPSTDINSGGELNTENNLRNIFGLISLGFQGLIPLLNTEILPGLFLGTLIFIPLTFTIVFAIIKLFKR